MSDYIWSLHHCILHREWVLLETRMLFWFGRDLMKGLFTLLRDWTVESREWERPKNCLEKKPLSPPWTRGQRTKQVSPSTRWVLNLWEGAANKDFDAELYSYCHAVTQQDRSLAEVETPTALQFPPPTDISHTRKWKWGDHLRVKTHI